MAGGDYVGNSGGSGEMKGASEQFRGGSDVQEEVRVSGVWQAAGSAEQRHLLHETQF